MTGTHTVVTGGAGFVGSHLVESLLADGAHVTVLDNFASGRRSNLAGIDDERPTLVEQDVRDPFPSLSDVDVVYHLASRASPVDFERHPVEIATTNSEGTRRALELTREHGARLLLASTSEVYGDPERHPQPESYNGNVNPRGPRAPYDEGKRFAEALATAHAREHGTDVRTARIFNTYGPRMRPNDGRVVPTFLSQALAGEDLTVHGDGTQTRSFCYVSDLVTGLRALADAPAEDAAGSVVNLGSTDEVDILTLAETVLEVVESDSAITHEPRPDADPEVRRPDVERARDLLGWESTVDLREGLARTRDWFERAV
jgi:UDP-glucuronate decarboxylase